MKKGMTLFFTLICSILLIVGCGVEQKESTSDVHDTEHDYKKISGANNEFGFQLMKDLKEDDHGNRFFSPASLFMALSMVYNGADGETKEEMAKALQVKGMDVDELNKANASLIHTLHQTKEIQLDIANSIWLNHNYQFQERFVENVLDHFKAEIETVDMGDQNSADLINNWVEKSTNGKIEDIINSVSPNIVSILLNAIYFQGNWTYEFNNDQTETLPFYGASKTVDAQLMRVGAKVQYLETDDFQAVSLPYGEDQVMSMDIWLPKDDFTLAELEKTLSDEQWKAWKNEFSLKEGTVLLPKFQIEYEIKLNEHLKQLGMTTAFDKRLADFSNMVQGEPEIWISDIRQKTFIDVNEEGTEAAAATVVVIVTESASADPPFYMEINRPFYFTITHEKTDTILFMGAIQQLE